MKLDVHPLTNDRWADLETLFGPRGAYSGCWCMYWRITRAQFEKNKNAGNKRAFRKVVKEGPPPGLLAYEKGEPVGWVSVAPREEFGSLNRSRVLKRIDDEPVWSIVCFYVPREHQGRGMLLALIRAACRYAKSQGGKIVEAYPTTVRGNKKLPVVSSYMGVPAVFEKAGFEEVARPSKAKVVLRKRLAR